MPRPRFEPVSECSICGLDFYESELQRHYKTNRLVDRLCADEPGADDYLEKMKRPVEHQKRAKQPVPRDENGYDPVEWATIIPTNGSGQVIGDNRAGIVTFVSSVPSCGFIIVYGTPRLAPPSDLLFTAWSPTAEGAPVDVVSMDATGFTVLAILQPDVTYQWRYEVR